MAQPYFNTPHPQIDTDPHFRRVISYMRPSDYVAWGGLTVGFPGAFYLIEMFDPTKMPRGAMRSASKLSTFLGFCGGFLYAYQNSSLRLWGFRENAREVARAKEEGPSALGLDTSKSSLDPYMQGVAHRNSANSQFKLGIMPWFNVVNHSHHGPGVAGGGDE